MPSDSAATTVPHWLVALDLEPDGNGPVEFTRWLHDTMGAGRAPQFVGMHVLEDSSLYPTLEHQGLAEVVKNARHAVLHDVDQAWASSAFHSLEVVHGNQASGTLHSYCEAQAAEAMVIGRHAPRAGRHLVRLGRVPRQVLREVVVPTVVVPPDFRADAAPTGPVLVATSMSESCEDVVRLGQALARAIQRPMCLANVRATPSRHAARYTPAASLGVVEARLQREAEAALAEWAAQHGAEEAQQRVDAGGTAEALLAAALSLDASMLVVGAKYAPLLERVFAGNIVSELAAHSPCPVAVVPPLREPQRARWQAWLCSGE